MRQYSVILATALMLVLLVSVQALAYRLVLIPTGDMLPEGMTKFEYGRVSNQSHHQPPNIDWFSGYKVDSRLPGNFEVYVQVKDQEGAKNLGTDVSVQYLVLAETKEVPNLSVGIWNINNEGVTSRLTGGSIRKARSPWVGASKGIPLPKLIKRTTRFHLGVGAQSLSGIWGGVTIFTSPFASIALEYDPKGIRLPNAGPNTAAFGYNWSPHFRTKYANLGGDHAFGVVYTDWFGKR